MAVVAAAGDMVSIHAPAKGATDDHGADACIGCFNPRPREGGDQCRGCPTRSLDDVSIHAPAKGATLRQLDRWTSGGVSIHAPAKGATLAAGLVGSEALCFNPRPREGGDPSSRSSTMAVARFNPRPREGGDQTAACRSGRCACFNPRPREGGDRRLPIMSVVVMQFQSTPPRRGRPSAELACDMAGVCFNPRPREGGDYRAVIGAWRRAMFQSTPPRRGRPVAGRMRLRSTMFQSTPPRRGRRRCRSAGVVRADVSIHAPAKGATSTVGASLGSIEYVSIHAPAKGATDVDQMAAGLARVSIHAPAKGATSAVRSLRSADGRFQSTPPRRGRP